ncbi:Undecaprenyl-diphosphatase [Candidatus Bilamarchaeum dharawalense]|uniref:Undecaprenyl-diphosphatase n=1 Tax=Candidatus Bilamarchaeum dharawalense TaxID=2885759 RepID=A0A5E4LYG9_9ARCH|nr:Undecaprenyl-diphosphatase [Candidatus Bilamarchaeum dharawalense]
MDFIQAIILGIIQGIAEWLPVSSKAMVALAGKFLFGMSYQDALSTAIFLHTGTLLAAIVYFRKEIFEIAQSVFKNKDRKLLVFLIITTAITGLMGLPLMFVALNFEFPEFLFTIVIGLFLIGIALLHKNRKESSGAQLTPKKALVAGFAQGLAAIPGVSRSGITLAALLSEKFDLEESLKISFLMSIPAVFGVELALPLIKGNFVVSSDLIAGSLVAAIVGFITIDALLKIAKQKNFYKIIFGLGILIVILGLGLLF